MKTINQKQEHTGSYYAATANEITDYPVLEGSASADVCVVGAGFTGVSAALALAEELGASDVLLEALDVSRAAGANEPTRLADLLRSVSGALHDAKRYDEAAELLAEEAAIRESSGQRLRSASAREMASSTSRCDGRVVPWIVWKM